MLWQSLNSPLTRNLRLSPRNQINTIAAEIRQTMRRTSLLLLFVTALVTLSSAARDLEPELTKSTGKDHGSSGGTPGDIPGFGSDPGGFFGSGSGFNVPGFGGGWGAGFGGPSGGYARGGVVRPSVVCSERGPCYKKRVTCPAKCFSSFSRSGKGYGAGGGGGGCTIDCKKSCVAHC